MTAPFIAVNASSTATTTTNPEGATCTVGVTRAPLHFAHNRFLSQASDVCIYGNTALGDGDRDGRSSWSLLSNGGNGGRNDDGGPQHFIHHEGVGPLLTEEEEDGGNWEKATDAPPSPQVFLVESDGSVRNTPVMSMNRLCISGNAFRGTTMRSQAAMLYTTSASMSSKATVGSCGNGAPVCTTPLIKAEAPKFVPPKTPPVSTLPFLEFSWSSTTTQQPPDTKPHRNDGSPALLRTASTGTILTLACLITFMFA